MTELLHAALRSHSDATPMLQHVQIQADVRGMLLEALVEQHFVNASATNAEVVYTFPLPFGAVLLNLEVQLGSKTLQGVVVEKKQAETRYEKALSDGDSPIMLEQNSDRSYSVNLGNLLPDEHCIIRMCYAQTLAFAGNGLRLMIPTVIAPRFGDPSLDAGMAPHTVGPHSLLSDYPFQIVLRLHGPLAQARVASPSHAIGIQHHVGQDGSVAEPWMTVTLARKASLDRDFVLVLDALNQTAMLQVARDYAESEQRPGMMVMASFCPRIASPVADKNHALKILVDCSGSMQGDSLEAAKRSLHAVVQQLAPSEQFSLSRFGHTVEHRCRNFWSATDTTVRSAAQWVEQLQADMGGTDMAEALQSTFLQGRDLPSDVLLITDGDIWDIEGVIARACVAKQRVFVVGIGSSPAESHLRRLAAATQGACDFVAPGEAVEPAILRMFSRLRSPMWTQVQVVWPEGTDPEWTTQLPTAVFDGDTLHVCAKLAEAPHGTVKLQGRMHDAADWIDISEVACSSDVQQTNTLARLAVAQRLDGILASNKTKKAQKERVKLAVAYQLVTTDTNYLLVHTRAEQDKPHTMPELHQVDQMVPAGWAGVGTVRASRLQKLEALSNGSMADYEMPSFLRKSPVEIAPSVLSEATHHTGAGMTPLQLCEWLHTHPAQDWPDSYSALLALGLDPWLVEWLELVMAQVQQPAYAEAVVVRSFLAVVAHTRLSHSFSALWVAFKQSLGIANLSGQHVEPVLVEAMRSVLQSMTAEQWPDGVWDMAGDEY